MGLQHLRGAPGASSVRALARAHHAATADTSGGVRADRQDKLLSAVMGAVQSYRLKASSHARALTAQTSERVLCL